MSAPKKTVGILLFDDVEVLDFAGPFEVFSRARLEPGVASRRADDSAPFRVVTVSSTGRPVSATGGLEVTPNHGFDDCPSLDLVLVPGGFGTRPLLEDATVLDWIRNVSATAERTLCVCTGSLLLAAAGLLEGRRATTHWAATEEFARSFPTVSVLPGERIVDDTVISSAGVSAGIDLAFYVVALECGADVAMDTARYMDYPLDAATLEQTS